MVRVPLLLCFISMIHGAQIFLGNFDSYSTAYDMDSWSFSNQVGEWQTYIHGGGQSNPVVPISNYIDLSSSYLNPGWDSSKQGARFKMNATSIWNSNTQYRCELIPSPQGNSYEAGTRYYQWSMKQDATNPLDGSYEHQLVFFEAHFADIKFISGNLSLVGFQGPLWTTPFTPNVWFNFAMMVDYSGSRVALYSSTGTNALTQVVAPFSTSVSTSDFHVGYLRLQASDHPMTGNTYVYYASISIQDSLAKLVGMTGSASTASSSSSSSSPTPSSTTRSSSTTAKSSSSSSSSTTARSSASSSSSTTAGSSSSSSSASTLGSSSSSNTALVSTSAALLAHVNLIVLVVAYAFII